MARQSADVRREQLVEAAIRVMIRDGVAKATTRAVVGEAGLPWAPSTTASAPSRSSCTA
ncbi:hypothetical protein AB6O49_04510 [Streptomyces sp. SBR177]